MSEQVNPISFPANSRSKAGYRLVFEDEFRGAALNTNNWLPVYLPQWSSREKTKPRYTLQANQLHLHIEADQEPWSEEYNGDIRVSNLQTGCFSGVLGGRRGQHPFRDDLVVKEAQPKVQLYTPTYGYVEVRFKAVALPGYMSALWMIGFEEQPEQSAEICVVEVKGENVGAERSRIGYGVHPFNDPDVQDEFYEDLFNLNAAQFHVYAVDWTPEYLDFYVDNQKVRTVKQAIPYAMQLMLNVYELPNALSQKRALPEDDGGGLRAGVCKGDGGLGSLAVSAEGKLGLNSSGKL